MNDGPEGAELFHSDRGTDRQTDRRTDRQADRQTGRQTDRQTDRQTGRQTDRQADRQKKLLVGFLNFAKAPEKDSFIQSIPNILILKL